VKAPRRPETAQADDAERVIAATRDWLERAVIGLGLCPFAEAPYVRDRIRFRVSAQESTDGLVEELAAELRYLLDADPTVCETTLLIHPHVLNDFGDYNQFLDDADAVVAALGFEGELQVASFHPAYRFADSEPNDVSNCTNRSPYPMLHLLREASVTRAVETFPGVHDIGANNIATLRALGAAGWRALWTQSEG
jgi:uncharacterized protein